MLGRLGARSPETGKHEALNLVRWWVAYGFAHATTSLDAVLDHETIDGVSLVPNFAYAEVIHQPTPSSRSPLRATAGMM